MGGVNDDHIALFPAKLLRSLQVVALATDSGSHAQPSLVVLGGVGILPLFLNVLDRDQTLEHLIGIDYQQLLDAMLVQ